VAIDTEFDRKNHSSIPTIVIGSKLKSLNDITDTFESDKIDGKIKNTDMHLSTYIKETNVKIFF
jgi:hypothetical protein